MLSVGRLRARIVLAAGDRLTNREIAEQEGVSAPTVTKWRARFAERRLAGLVDEPRAGRPRRIRDEDVEAVIIKTLQPRPSDSGHWSTRSMAKETGLTQNAVMRIWHAFGLEPHRQETRTPPDKPRPIEKDHDVVGLYLNPPERAVVLSVDERSQSQASPSTAPTLAMPRGTAERPAHHNEHTGSTSLYAALNVESDEASGPLHQRHRASEFLQFLKTIDANVPRHLAVHLVLDHAESHKTPTVKRWLQQHPRFRLHLTPTGSTSQNPASRN